MREDLNQELQREDFLEKVNRDLFVDSVRKLVIELHGQIRQRLDAAGVGRDDDWPIVAVYNTAEPQFRRSAVEAGAKLGEIEHVEARCGRLGSTSAYVCAASYRKWLAGFVAAGGDRAEIGLAAWGPAPGCIGVIALVYGKVAYTDIFIGH